MRRWSSWRDATRASIAAGPSLRRSWTATLAVALVVAFLSGCETPSETVVMRGEDVVTATPAVTAASAATATPPLDAPAASAPTPTPAFGVAARSIPIPADSPAAIPTATPPGDAAPTLITAAAPGLSGQSTPSPTVPATPDGPTVTIGEVAFGAEIARTPDARTKGLSDRDALPSQTGTLFVFETGRASSFWMRGMRIALDFIWIGDDCTVVDLTLGVPSPAPGTPDSELPTYRSSVPAAYTFEINAGEADRFEIQVGDVVEFLGSAGDLDGVGC